MKKLSSAIFLIAFLFLMNFSAFAQESDLKVVDEVVAQVNDGVITLSRVRREMNIVIEAMVVSGKTREEATAEVQAKQGEIIANIIEEELLLQRGKEIGVDGDVETTINQRFLDIMREQNLKTLDALYKEMEKQGLDPQEVRENWRKQYTQEFVIQREVSGKTYWGWSGKEIKAYYEKNKEKFYKPEVVTLSEIFLSFAGRDEAAVRDKAKQLVAEVRNGGDFPKIASENSDRPDARETKGSVGSISLPDLKKVCEKCITPVTATKVGGVSDPIETDVGIHIFRVDDRKAASTEAVFDESEVRRTMTMEVVAQKRKEYMVTLRGESYIKINDTYRPLVSPYLVAEETKKDEKKDKK